MAITFNPAISNKSYMSKKKQNPAFGQADMALFREIEKSPVEFCNRAGIGFLMRDIQDGERNPQVVIETIQALLDQGKIIGTAARARYIRACEQMAN